MKAGFITLEGLDGSGTTTQANLLVDALNNAGQTAEFTGEPTDGPIGKLVRQVLQGMLPGFDHKALALLFAADRLDHCKSMILPLVNSGGFVISDRYVHSSLAYQVEDAPLEWVQRINRFAAQPDLVIFLNVTPDTAMKRIEKRGLEREIFEKIEFQQRVMKNYLSAIKDLPQENKLMLNGENTKEEVHQAIIQRVRHQFGI